MAPKITTSCRVCIRDIVMGEGETWWDRKSAECQQVEASSGQVETSAKLIMFRPDHGGTETLAMSEDSVLPSTDIHRSHSSFFTVVPI